MKRTFLALAWLLPFALPASAFPLASGSGIREATALVTSIDYRCGPGYHIGRGGQRCWANGWAPDDEIPNGFVPPPRAPQWANNPPPVLECPPGFHLGRGLQRCWRN